MLNIYRTDERVLNKLTDFRDGVWVQMVDPTSNELSRVAEQYEIELDDLATEWMMKKVHVSVLKMVTL